MVFKLKYLFGIFVLVVVDELDILVIKFNELLFNFFKKFIYFVLRVCFCKEGWYWKSKMIKICMNKWLKDGFCFF